MIGREEKFDGATSKFLLEQSIKKKALTSSGNGGYHDPTAGSSSRALRGRLALGQTEVRNDHNEPRFHHLEQVFSTITRGIDPGRETNLHGNVSNWSGRCESFCRCRCHRRQRRLRETRLMAFTKSLGAFSFSFWSPFGEICDSTSCISDRSKWLKATYTFPVWLFHATVSLLTNCTASPELILRVYRRIPNNTDTLHNGTLYTFVARGDTDNVKRLLLRKEAAITDVKAFGGESILHTAFNFRHRIRDLSMIRLLVQEGADWFQAKDNGHLPCELDVRRIGFKSEEHNIIDNMSHFHLRLLEDVPQTLISQTSLIGDDAIGTETRFG